MDMRVIKNIQWVYVALVGVMAVVLLYMGGIFAGLELFFEDLLVSPKSIDERLVILAIDDESIARIGQWPWPRAVFADALNMLVAMPPQAVGIDVLFAEDSRVGGADDVALAQAIVGVPFRVVQPVLGAPLVFDGARALALNPIVPRAGFRVADNAVLGNTNLIIDRDGVARHFPDSVEVVLNDSATTVPAFAHSVIGYGDMGQSGTIGGATRIVYAGNPGSVRTIPFWRVFEGDVDLSDLFVFIGATAPSLHDEQLTPLSRGRAMSGVEIQAQIANMALNGYVLATVPLFLMVLWLIVATLVPWLLFAYIRLARVAIAVSVTIGVVYIVTIILLFDAGYVASIVHITLAWIVGTAFAFGYRYFVTGREKRQLRHAFSKYVSPAVLDDIMARPEILALGGEDRDVTIFFSDVRGFTTLSESMSPSDLVSFLNKYLTRMTDLALDAGGVIDKYIGDAIMAFWGAPLHNARHALDAVMCSLDMIDDLERFNSEMIKEGHAAIDIGIGLNSGMVTVGNMGSEQRFDYTVMGDAVNLAARLEGQTKTYGIHLLISENTRRYITIDMEREHDMVIRELDRIAVKGKTEPVVVHQVVDRSRASFVRDIMSTFNTAREMYYAGRWSECLVYCETILAKSDDGPTRLLKTRVEQFVANPPADWQGVFKLTSK